MFDKIRKYIVKKLIRPDDGYTFTGFSEGQPIKFYYQEDTGKYLLGMRSDNWYYFTPGISGLHSYSSRYLPWGKTINNYTYNAEPQEIDFRSWFYGILDNIHEEYIDNIMAMDYKGFHEYQMYIKMSNKKYKEDPWVPFVTTRGE